MNTSRLDLNLLPLLDALLQGATLSRAAERLGMTQPAASNALARLRLSLGDALFVRSGRGLTPTPFAQSLAAPLHQALGALEQALATPVDFSPHRLTTTFRLGASDILVGELAAPLLQAVAAEAPDAKLRFSGFEARHAYELLDSGRLDLLLGVAEVAHPSMRQFKLRDETFVLLLRRGHRALRQPMTLSRYLACEHLLIAPLGNDKPGIVDRWLAQQGLQRRVRLTLPSFLAAGPTVARSDLIATMPTTLAQQLAKAYGLALRPAPFAALQFALHAFWHVRVDQDPAHRWLRALLRRHLKS